MGVGVSRNRGLDRPQGRKCLDCVGCGQGSLSESDDQRSLYFSSNIQDNSGAGVRAKGRTETRGRYLGDSLEIC